jgi:hypothetical protein
VIIAGNGDVRQGFSKGIDLPDIDRGRNVDTTMTDVNADFHHTATLGVLD